MIFPIPIPSQILYQAYISSSRIGSNIAEHRKILLQFTFIMLPRKVHPLKTAKNKQNTDKKGLGQTIAQLLGPEYLSGLLNPADFSTDQKSQHIDQIRSEQNQQNPKRKTRAFNFCQQSEVGCVPCQMLPVSEDEQVEQPELCQAQKQIKKKRRLNARAKNDRLQHVAASLTIPTQAQVKIEEQSHKKQKQGGVTKKNGKQFSCKCKKTHCLKSYCECFLNNLGCNESCTCLDCANWVQAQPSKKQKTKKTIEQGLVPIQKMLVGSCQCKKTNCIKKYCECFNSGRACGELCKCEGCKNITE